MTDNVIDLNEYRKRRGLNPVAPVKRSNVVPIKQVPNNDGLVRIYDFDPDADEYTILYTLVYNQPSVLDSYYAIYPYTVAISRYDDHIDVVCVHTGQIIVSVAYQDGYWYSAVAPNVDA